LIPHRPVGRVLSPVRHALSPVGFTLGPVRFPLRQVSLLLGFLSAFLRVARQCSRPVRSQLGAGGAVTSAIGVLHRPHLFC
jgi:hypothetical protein